MTMRGTGQLQRYMQIQKPKEESKAATLLRMGLSYTEVNQKIRSIT